MQQQDPWAEFRNPPQAAPQQAPQRAPQNTDPIVRPAPNLQPPSIGEQQRLAMEAERLRIAQSQEARDVQEAEREAAAAEQSQQAMQTALADSAAQIRRVIQAAQEAKGLSQNGFFTTGFGSETMRGFAGTGARDVQALLNTIGSNTAFDRLQRMRDESPTGGALGAVSEIELQLLRDSIASLDQSQSDEQFQANMDRIISAYQTVLDRIDANPRVEQDRARNVGIQDYIGAREEPIDPNDPDIPLRGTVSDPGNDPDGNPIGPDYTGPSYDNDGNLIGYIVRDSDGNRQWMSQAAMDRANQMNERMGEMGALDLARHNVGGRLTDEAAGIGGAIGGVMRGDFDVVGNYQTNRDAEQYRIDQARQRAGMLGTAAELVGGGAGVLSRAGSVMRAGRAAAAANGGQVTRAGVQRALTGEATRGGALVGGVFGFGEGRGLENSTTNALLGAAVGGATGNVGQRLGNALANRAERAEATREAVATVADAAERRGINLLPADVGGTGTRMATGVVRRTLGEIPIAAGAQRSVESARTARNAVADDIGRVTDQAGAGQAIRRGLDNWQANTNDKVERLFEAVPIPPNRAMILDETRGTLRELTRGLRSNPELSRIWATNPRLQQTLEALQGGRLTWGDAQAFRSTVGNIIGRPSLTSEGPEIAQLRGLYAALTRDMEATATRSGPRALTLWRRAVDYKRGRENRIEQVVSSILGPRNNRSDEAVFQQINRWANQRGGDFKAIARTLRSLDAEEANTVRATLLGRMGRATAGRQNAEGDEFSPAQFVTEWNGMDERARSMLFPTKEHRAAINDLVTVMAQMKRAGDYQNYSMTSLGTNAVANAGLTLTNPVAGALAAAGQFGAGRLLASERFARFLVSLARGRMPARVADKRLEGLVRAEPALASELTAFRNSLAANDNLATAPNIAAQENQEQQ